MPSQRRGHGPGTAFVMKPAMVHDAPEYEGRWAEPRKERREQDRGPDEVQDAEDDVDGGEEEPGDGGDDEAVAEYRESAPGVLERKVAAGEALRSSGIADGEGDPDDEDERRRGHVGEHAEEPAGDGERQDAEEVEVEGGVKDDHRHDGDAPGGVDLPVALSLHGFCLQKNLLRTGAPQAGQTFVSAISALCSLVGSL